MKERLRKIYELSVRGVDGERENAQKLLTSLLARHRLTIEDLIGEEKIHHEIKYRGKLQRKMLLQIVAHVIGDLEKVEVYTRRNRKELLIFDLTASEIAEVELLYSEYWKAFEKEQERLLSAFISRNNIYPESKDDRKEFTPEEMAELRRVMRMAANMEAVDVGRKRMMA